MRLSFIIVFCIFIIGCYESNLPEENEIEFSEEVTVQELVLRVDNARLKLQALDLADGVDFKEANTILDSFYMSGKADGCGSPGNIVDSGKRWKAATFVGFSARRSDPIFIDKKTGTVERNNKVLVENPLTLTIEYPAGMIEMINEMNKINVN